MYVLTPYIIQERLLVLVVSLNLVYNQVSILRVIKRYKQLWCVCVRMRGACACVDVWVHTCVCTHVCVCVCVDVCMLCCMCGCMGKRIIIASGYAIHQVYMQCHTVLLNEDATIIIITCVVLSVGLRWWLKLYKQSCTYVHTSSFST